MFSQVCVTSTPGQGGWTIPKINHLHPGQCQRSQHFPPLSRIRGHNTSPPWLGSKVTTPPLRPGSKVTTPPWSGSKVTTPPWSGSKVATPPHPQGQRSEHLPPDEGQRSQHISPRPGSEVTTPPPWPGSEVTTPPPARVKGHNTSLPGTMRRRGVRILLECFLVLNDFKFAQLILKNTKTNTVWFFQ